MPTKPQKTLLSLLILLLLTACSNKAQQPTNSVTIIGAMKNVMWQGALEGSIQLDTISNKTHLYGLGPTAYLTGEILIMNGTAYTSTVVNDSTMHVEASYQLSAPFFGYANIPKWSAQPLPDSVQTLPQLEQYLDSLTSNSARPFLFKLIGTVEDASIHIVNLPQGSKVSSPNDAHQGLVRYPLHNTAVEILGFFSTEHKAIFTHHDTTIHAHLITQDRQKMGHLDDVVFQKQGMVLYLPVD